MSVRIIIPSIQATESALNATKCAVGFDTPNHLFVCTCSAGRRQIDILEIISKMEEIVWLFEVGGAIDLRRVIPYNSLNSLTSCILILSFGT